MSAIDWTVFVAFLVYVVWDGLRQRPEPGDASGYFLAGRNVPWWAMGMSIMATQASAITMIGTTGKGWEEGLRFAQFYFALPLAMVILAFTAVPLYHRLQVTTAYEYLGIRFDAKTRLLSAVLFLVLRGLSVGFIIYAPALIVSRVLYLPLEPTIVVTGMVAVVYTAVGGLGAVIRTDVKQLTVMTVGLIVAFSMLLAKMPDGVGVSQVLAIASAADRLEVVNWAWDPSEKYTIWSSLLGGLFLFLSYFGTDQSQVQRLLSGKSLSDTRRALLMNAVFKIPFQFLVLGCGVLLFVFYTFQRTPESFVPAASRMMPAVELSGEVAQLSAAYDERERETRAAARNLANAVTAEQGVAAASERFRAATTAAHSARVQLRTAYGDAPDTNYVFLDFILNHLPMGLVGLLLAAICAAALSSIDSELNSMATVAVVDIYEFGFARSFDGRRLQLVSRLATLMVGIFATAFALYAGQLGSLIEGVNRVGSYIYGSLLGAFVLAIGVKRANGHGAFFGLLVGMAVVTWAQRQDIAFLYLNTIGTVTVVVIGTLISLATKTHDPAQRG